MLYRGPSIDASFDQAVSEEKIFFYKIDQPDTRIAYTGHVG